MLLWYFYFKQSMKKGLLNYLRSNDFQENAQIVEKYNIKASGRFYLLVAEINTEEPLALRLTEFFKKDVFHSPGYNDLT